MAQITHHEIKVSLGININITVAPKNKDLQERDSMPTLPMISMGERCGTMIKDMYLSLDAFRTQFYSKVRSSSKSDPPISKDFFNRTLAKRRTLYPHHLLARYLIGYLKTSKADGSREKRVWERSPQVESLRWWRCHRNEASHTLESLVHIFSHHMKSTRAITPMERH